MMDSLPSNDENNRNPLPLDGRGEFWRYSKVIF
jgi:hypothetical protein